MTDKSRIRPADAAGIAAAVAVLRAGGIVAVPTETVYGLAGRASDADAVARIYAAKGRPGFNPLIVHVAGVAQAETLVVVDAVARALMAEYWPGPLTLVLPLRDGADVAAPVTAGLGTLAVRCPAHPVMQALIAAVGPLAAPSANASGRISPTRAEHVAGSLGDSVGLILDGGPAHAGVESTIAMVADGVVRVLRPGAVLLPPSGAGTDAARAPALPSRHNPPASGEVVAPGMLASHYAPRQPVRLEAVTALPGEFHIGFGAVAGDVSLSPAGDVVEAAARLFELLHAAEASGRAAIAVAPVPMSGLGVAINDRLQRAAAPK
ncbi:L-threonylcarbamoyladenylate synthase [Polymorphobacter fuscus]|uniref:Threonylcarbamoyl-AMP synthase n=1 Tax=Sandarakinorhabdus fusca TaxID=1439888 RepID=A0A7C9KX84_9SPHN|nr:L-threonylcarbamoyladenylate synthase [Polymorphobacter fuscus]KAB7646409.1 threonylcarbamoyl-AMP synthase [Polymorphobacter fuscus]MQT17645.1 threonylcarbamoyl-AMP synthase [Polymorphobacter fuscus]NJC09810.1 L-threonylcarbamoyladenylate synthase [Polymorphobacter fuscus]